MIWLANGLQNLKIQNDANSSLYVSIIVAVKNEQKNIKRLVESLINQDYPDKQYEIIIVNDQSSDNTYEILKNLLKDSLNLKIINVEEVPSGWSSKKWALNLAIEAAKFDIILQTDGDCIVGQKWINSMVSSFNNPGVGFVAGHTPFVSSSNNFIYNILELDNFSQDAFIGSCISKKIPLSCVGRSIGFRKKYFYDVNGYHDFKNEISGDDDLLMHRIIYDKKCQIEYIINQNSYVYTSPPQTIKEFINQRLRYASKGKLYYNAFFINTELRLILPFLFINNLFFVISLLSFCYNPKMIYFFPIVIKMFADSIIIFSFSNIINKKFNFYLFIFLSLIHPFYIVTFSLVGPFVKFDWKNNEK